MAGSLVKPELWNVVVEKNGMAELSAEIIISLLPLSDQSRKKSLTLSAEIQLKSRNPI